MKNKTKRINAYKGFEDLNIDIDSSDPVKQWAFSHEEFFQYPLNSIRAKSCTHSPVKGE